MRLLVQAVLPKRGVDSAHHRQTILVPRRETRQYSDGSPSGGPSPGGPGRDSLGGFGRSGKPPKAIMALGPPPGRPRVPTGRRQRNTTVWRPRVPTGRRASRWVPAASRGGRDLNQPFLGPRWHWVPFGTATGPAIGPSPRPRGSDLVWKVVVVQVGQGMNSWRPSQNAWSVLGRRGITLQTIRRASGQQKLAPSQTPNSGRACLPHVHWPR